MLPKGGGAWSKQHLSFAGSSKCARILSASVTRNRSLSLCRRRHSPSIESAAAVPRCLVLFLPKRGPEAKHVASATSQTFRRPLYGTFGKEPKNDRIIPTRELGPVGSRTKRIDPPKSIHVNLPDVIDP